MQWASYLREGRGKVTRLTSRAIYQQSAISVRPIRAGSTGTAVSDQGWNRGHARGLAARGLVGIFTFLFLEIAGVRASPVPRIVAIDTHGPSPSTLPVTASMGVPSWSNLDSVEHTVTFRNGRCVLTLAPNSQAFCSDSFWHYVGRYPYLVSGVSAPEGLLVVDPAPRDLTLRASAPSLAKGSKVTLSGTLTYAVPIPPADLGQPVTLMRRINGSKRFVAFRTVRPHLRRSGQIYDWKVVLRPSKTALYRARDFVQPAGGMVWRNAQTPAITVRVH